MVKLFGLNMFYFEACLFLRCICICLCESVICVYTCEFVCVVLMGVCIVYADMCTSRGQRLYLPQLLSSLFFEMTSFTET